MLKTYIAAIILTVLSMVKNNKVYCQSGNIQKDYIINTDKAVYKPGEKVIFTINVLPAAAYVRYWYLNKIIKSEPLHNTSWNWQPSLKDYRGYIAEVYRKTNGQETVVAAVAIDVSSDWNRFPRYGFLSEFETTPGTFMDSVINTLARCHINGLQFYDWQDKHHQPLSGTVSHPAENWQDIANRNTSKTTMKNYIAKAHRKGMRAMFYNLCYGALSGAETDGVQPQWYMYNDTGHTQRNTFTLPSPPFKSNIYFTDPANKNWQQYLVAKNEEVYRVFDFDGYHVDQVGDRGVVYNYEGRKIDLTASFNPFLVAMKAAHPAKRLIMNAVNQYGQQGSIAGAPVDFMYSELWTGNEGYKELTMAIQNNYAWSSGKSTVLAAYMNYEKASRPGTFNTAGVLLTNSVIFAAGGSHLELGEHMLGKEYFPNNNLRVTPQLKSALINYYDFLTGYQNLLRDGGHFNTPSIGCANKKMTVNAWPPIIGQVSVMGKKIAGKQVLHFINFTNALTLNWRDTDGTQPEPALITDARIQLTVPSPVARVWTASPDLNIVPQAIGFLQSGNLISFDIPSLKYWDMVVIEYK